jgi:divalent metal cation (Fe/Co/Zn/Cd) transporter
MSIDSAERADPKSEIPLGKRQAALFRALLLEWLTLGWMAIEATVAIGSGIVAHSVSLTAFGLDSVVEMASAGVLVWRLRWEISHECADDEAEDHHERIELRAARVTSILLWLICAYVVVEAAMKLLHRQGADFSTVGLAVTSAAIPVMLLLSRAKRRLADDLGSGALRADAAQGTACWYLAAVVIIGTLALRFLHLWWVDAVASLLIVGFLVREAREA